ncbi:hypothetical protein O0550_13130 [Brevibacillus halotolerans]|uniref:hypothetical protein n=1 Tax=Brevibacillus TaxID=55080 RepID=UPI00215C6DE8|nr:MULTISPECIES: hypothetical protein [Brevibacillus]MCR8964138.1 hypothetical protein [Brevibacillus laterosporus]MCZ0836293.1 hypothetical protein [Brevibacillus halotolerans]
MKKIVLLLSTVLIFSSGITACSNGSTSNSAKQEQSKAGTPISSYSNVVDDIN